MNEEMKKWKDRKKGSTPGGIMHRIASEEIEKLKKDRCNNCDKIIKKGEEFCSDRCEKEYSNEKI